MQDRFTVYDVFAMLVPGVVFIYLLAFTLDRAVGIQIFDWTGSVGDICNRFARSYRPQIRVVGTSMRPSSSGGITGTPSESIGRREATLTLGFAVPACSDTH